MLLPVYLGLLESTERTLAQAFRHVAHGHGDEPDVHHLCHTLAAQCDAHVAALAPVIDRYGEQPDDEPERLRADGLSGTRSGPLGLLRDLQDLYLLASLTDITWTAVGQAARGLRDSELSGIVGDCEGETDVQLRWLRTRLAQAAPQALLIAR